MAWTTKIIGRPSNPSVAPINCRYHRSRSFFPSNTAANPFLLMLTFFHLQPPSPSASPYRTTSRAPPRHSHHNCTRSIHSHNTPGHGQPYSCLLFMFLLVLTTERHHQSSITSAILTELQPRHIAPPSLWTSTPVSSPSWPRLRRRACRSGPHVVVMTPMRCFFDARNPHLPYADLHPNDRFYLIGARARSVTSTTMLPQTMPYCHPHRQIPP